MAKNLNEKTRIHVYGENERGEKVKAFALIGFDYRIQGEPDGSVVNLVRGNDKKLRSLLSYYGEFTEKDLEEILNLGFKNFYWADEYSCIIRLA